MPVLGSYVCDHAASPRMSVNADFSIALKCLALGKKPIVPQRTLANFSTRAVTILRLPHTSFISLCTIPTIILYHVHTELP